MNTKKNFLERLKLIWQWKLDSWVMLFTGRLRRDDFTESQVVADLRCHVGILEHEKGILEKENIKLNVDLIDLREIKKPVKKAYAPQPKKEPPVEQQPLEPKIDDKKQKKPKPQGGLT